MEDNNRIQDAINRAARGLESIASSYMENMAYANDLTYQLSSGITTQQYANGGGVSGIAQPIGNFMRNTQGYNIETIEVTELRNDLNAMRKEMDELKKKLSNTKDSKDPEHRKLPV